MDMSLVASIMANKAAAGRDSMAVAMIKQSTDAERQAVTTLLDGAVEGARNANLAAGVGGIVDISA